MGTKNISWIIKPAVQENDPADDYPPDQIIHDSKGYHVMGRIFKSQGEAEKKLQETQDYNKGKERIQ